MSEAGGLTLAWVERNGRHALAIRLGPPPHASASGSDMLPSRLGASDQLGVVPASILGRATTPDGLQAIAGRFTLENDAWLFEPEIPFLPATEYALITRTETGALVPLATIATPAAPAIRRTEVLAIYPSTLAVPINFLRIYVHFSAPMREAQAAQAISVQRLDTGELLRDTFLPGTLELWNPSRTRLTLLLDPGRIKRGLLPHVQMGYPLIEQVPVLVRVLATFQDAAGAELLAGAERRYEVDAALRRHIDIGVWRVVAPPASTLAPLIVLFDRALDSAMLAHTLTVSDEYGSIVTGTATVTDGERAWSFVPRLTWMQGQHTLHVDPRLEDIAGNSLVRVFDRDLTRPEDAPVRRPRTALAFACS